MAAAIERIFLGWDVPALESAAARLVEYYAAGGEARLEQAVVVVPGARAGRRLTELLLEAAERRGARLVPPRVVTAGALPELLYEPERPLAEPTLSRRVWALVLRALGSERVAPVFPRPPAPDDVRGWDALARQVERLHGVVGGAGLGFRDVAERCREGLLFDDRARWEALARAQQAYLDRLRALGFEDRDAARVAALERGAVATEREIWLVGVVELPAVAKRMLEAVAGPVRALVHAPAGLAGAFDGLGGVRPEAWLEAEVPVADGRLLFAGGPGDQAAAVPGVLAALEGRYAAEEITVGVPDGEVVPYLQQRLPSAGLPVRYAGGTPLARTGPYRLLAAVAEYLQGRRFDALAALLRHPDLESRLCGRDAAQAAPSGPMDAWLGAADRYHRESLPASMTGELAGSGEARAAVEAAVHALGELLARLGGWRRLAEWAPEILRLLVDVYGGEPLDRATPDGRAILEACDRLRAAAAALYRLPEAADEACDAATAIRLLLAEAQGAAIPAEPDRAAIELLGWLELHLDDAPVLVLTGMNDPRVPESVNADAFLPNALRARLGLPDNDSRFARDAYLLTAILASRPEVWLIAGRRDAAGDPLRPSRLLFAAPPRVVAGRVRRFYGEDAAGEPPPAVVAPAAAGVAEPAVVPPAPVVPAGDAAFRLPPEPELSAPEPITELRVTDFRALLEDPYRFALERVLGLETLDDAAPELDAALFGSLAHAVLGRFGASDAAATADAAAIARRLDELLDEEADRRFGRGALPALPVQLEQLRARLHAFAEWQARWVAEGWRVVAVEVAPPGGGVPFDVDGLPIALHGRIDRIDHHPATGEWAVFDYKTSDRGEGPEKAHRRGRGDQRRWVDLQLPLYRHLLRALRGPDGAPLVPAHRSDAVRLGYILLPRDLSATGAAFADWDAADLAAADETARDVVRLVRANRFVFDPERVSLREDDGFGRLLGLGQLVATTAGGEDEEEGEA